MGKLGKFFKKLDDKNILQKATKFIPGIGGQISETLATIDKFDDALVNRMGTSKEELKQAVEDNPAVAAAVQVAAASEPSKVLPEGSTLAGGLNIFKKAWYKQEWFKWTAIIGGGALILFLIIWGIVAMARGKKSTNKAKF